MFCVNVFFQSNGRMWFQKSGHLRVQVLAFDTKVGVDDVQAHQQAHNHCSLLLQHQCWILIEITVGEETLGYNKHTVSIMKVCSQNTTCIFYKTSRMYLLPYTSAHQPFQAQDHFLIPNVSWDLPPWYLPKNTLRRVIFIIFCNFC